MLTKNTKDLVNAFGYLRTKEAELLQNYAKKIPKNGICVNIGAGTGTSAVAVLEMRPDLTNTFYTIDISNHNNPFGGLLNERNAFDKYKMSYPNQIHGDSKEIGKTWDKGEVDFLIIDGDHSTEGASGDILIWKENLKNSAIIFVHDYAQTTWVAVYNVVNELMYDSEDFEFVALAETYIIFRYIRKEKE